MSTSDLRPRARQLAMVLLSCGALWSLSAAQAATSGNKSAAEKRYQEDRALCMSGLSAEDKKTCLREAGAALQAARAGKLAESRSPNYEQNALARCNVLPPADRPSCEAMMREGSTQGSVESGGIYREYREIVPAPQGGTR
ncbi:MAG: hypothetical protein ACLGHY_05905 [Gammaproteobacteria bacterium]